ncbi:MAG: hypothetical protein IPK82_17835 [Polyangiaceae bacterium]|nr:hypothetical protein [Polyangiaceae bacterium]
MIERSAQPRKREPFFQFDSREAKLLAVLWLCAVYITAWLLVRDPQRAASKPTSARSPGTRTPTVFVPSKANRIRTRSS